MREDLTGGEAMSQDFYFPTYIGLLSPEHREKIGPALWEFLWFISKTTKEFQEGNESLGIVLGGRPIKVEEIIEELGISEKTVRRNITRLKQHGYIETTRAPYGEIYRVRRSKKFLKSKVKSKPKRVVTSDHSTPTEWSHMTERVVTYDQCNKDIKDIKEEEEEDGQMLNENDLSLKHEISNKFIQRRNKGLMLSPDDEVAIERLIGDKIPVDKILTWMDEIFDEYKPKHRLDQINKFVYVEQGILTRWAKQQSNKKNETDWDSIEKELKEDG